MIALRVVRGVTKHFVARWTEWLLSSILFALGCKLLGASDTFASSPGFRTMEAIGNEDTWGFFLCGISGFRLIALGLNGTFDWFARWSPIARCGFAALSGFAWFSIAMGIFLSNPNGWGHLTYSGLLIADIINAMLAGGDAGASERRRRNGSSRQS